ncbi:helix-turn-helix domain-containing protein [Clostridioides sp. ES-S-0048-02]|uniref:helix-turn-helix domain-containing protein n=1 Tax=Clostridioides sp. ES-S-0048-02 TaxID=2770777 RepID=UPI001D1016EB|nr:helix-turn-helix transcriptional regulator [Clostridioides sp. ES-S-0048-02]
MNIEDKILIGKRLKEQRKKLDLTLEDVARLTSLSKGYLSNIEKGSKSPSLITFIKIINSLNISADSIINGTDEFNKLNVSSNINESINDLNSQELNLIMDIIKSIKKNRSLIK